MSAMVERTPVRGMLHAAYTLCTADCDPKEHFHVPDYKRCDRCGALIHNQIFEVVTEAGEELTVGSECMKDVLGYRWGTWHDRALTVAKEIQEKVTARQQRDGYRTIVPVAWIRFQDAHNIVTFYNHRGSHMVGPMVKVSYGFSSSLWRAGVDLGLWSGEHYGKKYHVEVYDLTPDIRNDLHTEDE